jgi:hypothetical protein
MESFLSVNSEIDFFQTCQSYIDSIRHKLTSKLNMKNVSFLSDEPTAGVDPYSRRYVLLPQSKYPALH